MSRKGFTAGVVTLLPVNRSSLVCFYAWVKHNQQDGANPVKYDVAKDDMGTKLSISVASDIDEGQLRATLRKAADDHQYDAARDLLLSDYLWVEAYLTDGQSQSGVAAGRLRRYVPPKNANRQSGNWWDWISRITGREDQLSISLSEARQSLF